MASLAVRPKDQTQSVVEEREEYFIAFDGKLIKTYQGDATKALMLLCASFYVFNLSYPKALTAFYRFMEAAMGMKKGMEQTGPMTTFIEDLFPESVADMDIATDEEEEEFH